MDQVEPNTEETCVCGGCGILITSWDTLGDPQDGKVFVDTCDQCTTGKMGRHRGHAAEAVARALKTDILLVRDDWGDGEPASFKDAIVAPVKDVEALLEKWNKEGRKLASSERLPWQGASEGTVSLTGYGSQEILATLEDLRTPEDEECGAEGPQGLKCTRPDSHLNPGTKARWVHVAHVQDEPVAMWVEVQTSYVLKKRDV